MTFRAGKINLSLFSENYLDTTYNTKPRKVLIIYFSL